MNGNAQNQLLELLKNLGCSEDCADFQPESMAPSGFHQSTVVVSFPDGRTVQGSGMGARKPDARSAAANDSIEQLSNNHPDLIVDWADIKVQAQAGDLLIKLGVYLAADIKSASDKSEQLHSLESNSHLANVFDLWKAQGDADLAIWGTHLGEIRKATIVEALIWRRFGAQVITPDASEKLEALLNNLVID
jgi:hypothetical protein